MISPLAYRFAQMAALQAMSAELESIGVRVPLVLTANGRTANARSNGIFIGDGFSPAEIPGVVRHEAGHEIRGAIHLTRQRLGDQGIFVNEQESDAIAGWLTVRAGDSVGTLLATLATLPSDPSHGGFTERATAVLVGAVACLVAQCVVAVRTQMA